MSNAKRAAVALEALAALALVLLVHGGAFRSAERVLEELSPPPRGISLELARQVAVLPRRSPQWPESYPRVSVPEAKVQGYAPPGSRVRIFVNNVLRDDVQVNETAKFAYPVLLRPGFNYITAQMEERGRIWSELYKPIATLTVERIATKSPLFLYARARMADGKLVAYGIAAPTAFVEMCNGARPMSYTSVIVDALGGFKVALGTDDDADLRVWTDVTRMTGCDDRSVPRVNVATAPLASIARELTIHLAENKPAALRLVVRLPEDHPAAQAARDGVVGADELTTLLGVDGARAAYWRPRTDPSAFRTPTVRQDTDLSFIVDAATEVHEREISIGEAFDRYSQAPFMSLAGDRLELVSARPGAVRTNAIPTETTEKDGITTSIWREPVALGVKMTIVTGYNDEAALDSSEERGQEVERERVEEKAGQRSVVPVLNRLREVLPQGVTLLGHALLSAVPFIWCFLVLGRCAAASPDAPALRAFVLTLLVLHAGYWLSWLVSSDLAVWQIVRSLFGDERARPVMWFEQVLMETFPPLTIGAAYLAARLDRVLEQPMQQTPAAGWRLLRVFVIAPLIALALFKVGEVMFAKPPDGTQNVPLSEEVHPQFALAMVAFALLTGWLFVYWLLRTAFRRAVPLALTFAISLLLIIVPIAPALLRAGVNLLRTFAPQFGLSPFVLPWLQQIHELAWTIVIMIGGALTLHVLWTRTAAAAQLAPAHGATAWHRYARPALLTLAALPVGMLMGDTVNVWTLSNFFGPVSDALPAVLLVAIYYVFARATQPNQFVLAPVVLALGALLFGFYLSGATTNLLFVPLPLLLGHYLFRRHLLIDRDPTTLPAQAERTQVLRALIALKNAEQLHHVFRTHGERKYGEGALTRDAFESGLATAEARIDAARTALPGGEDEARRIVFSQGPGDDPLDNAKRALLYGAPLIVLYQLATFDQIFQVESGAFPLLGAMVRLATALSYWAVLAYVFGYFYHAIGGADGPGKARALALALVLPMLVVLILNNRPILGIGAGEQMLRVLLFVAYLAVAFDWAVIRKAGYERRHLVLVYGVVPAFAYASSLAALGGLSLTPFVKTSACWMLQALGVDVCTPASGS